MKKKGIYSITREETYHDGQIIYKEDSYGDLIYVVLNGFVETSRNIRGRVFIIEKLQPGDIFGEMELIGGTRRSVTARAVGETVIGIIDMEPLKNECDQLSMQFSSILKTIPVRLKKMLDRASDFSG